MLQGAWVQHAKLQKKLALRFRVFQGAPLTRGCRCSIEHYQSVLRRFPEAERADMRNDAGDIVVDCAFCSRSFNIPD